MNKIFAVIRREFLERVRTKAFVLGTIIFPVFLVAMMVVPALLLTKGGGTRRIAVVDGTSSGLGARLESALTGARRAAGGDGEPGQALFEPVLIQAGDALPDIRDSLLLLTGVDPAKVTDGEVFDGLLLLTEDALVTGKVDYLGANVGSPSDMSGLERRLRPVILTARLERAGVDPAVVMHAIGPVDLVTRKVTDGKLTGESGEASFILAYVMGFLIYMGLLLYGIQVMTSIVEEKGNRIVEVLASSLTPFQMMLGKVVGVGAVGLFQFSIWATTAMVLTTYRAQIAGVFGLSPTAFQQMALPTVPPDLLAVFLLFFALGFLIYAAMYAAVGAMCNTVQDTQQAQAPVMFIIIGGLFSVFALINDPTGSAAQTLTMVPFLSPFVVPVRHSLAPLPLSTILLSAAVTLLGLMVVVWIAGRIYRVGILSYGKRASLRDVWRWIRAA